jgi:hypothetical protein
MASEYLGTEERYAVFPFYLCLDVSQSMSGEPIAQVNAELPQIRSSVGQDPAVAEVIRFGVVTFSDGARTVLPLVDLALVESMPTVEVEGKTSYSAAFDHLRRVIEADYHAGRLAGERWYRPAVLFVSDGRPTDPEERWLEAHRRRPLSSLSSWRDWCSQLSVRLPAPIPALPNLFPRSCPTCSRSRWTSSNEAPCSSLIYSIVLSLRGAARVGSALPAARNNGRKDYPG